MDLEALNPWLPATNDQYSLSWLYVRGQVQDKGDWTDWQRKGVCFQFSEISVCWSSLLFDLNNNLIA